MTNYVMFWDAYSLVDPVEQELAQRIRELMKLYEIPGGAQADFVLMEHTKPDQTRSEEEELDHILKQISAQVGAETEWRLIILQVSSAWQTAEECRRLECFLACLMGYESPLKSAVRPKLNRFYLTCETPENIWIVTVQDVERNRPPVESSTVYGEISGFSAYPPNCRFFLYPLDFRKKNSFDWQILGLHSGLRYLAENLLPSDLFRGNCFLRLEAELDGPAFCDCVNRYAAWLREVDGTLQQMERNCQQSLPRMDLPANPERMPTSTADVRKRLNIRENDPKKRLNRLKEETDRILDETGRKARQLLNTNLERLQKWEEALSGGGLSDWHEAYLREQMERAELEMLEPETPRDDFLGRVCQYLGIDLEASRTYQAIRQLFHVNGPRSRWEKEYLYTTEMLEVLYWKRRTTILHAAMPVVICFIFVVTALNELGTQNMGSRILVSFVLLLALMLAVLVGYHIALWLRREYAFNAILKQEIDRIVNNRKYFNRMFDYLRLSRILRYNEQQKIHMQTELGSLKRQWAELDRYQAVCARLMVCRSEVSGSGTKPESRGNIRRILKTGSRQELFGLGGTAARIEINGNPVYGALPFVKEVRLIRQAERPHEVKEAEHED